MADEEEPKYDLAEQALGDGDGEQDALVLRKHWSKGVVKRLLRLIGLLIDELPADIVEVGEVADRLSAEEGFKGEALTLLWVEVVGGTGAVVGEGPP